MIPCILQGTAYLFGLLSTGVVGVVVCGLLCYQFYF